MGADDRLGANAEVELLRDGRYAVTGILGEGSQGETLEAVDKRDGRLVAVKRFRIKGAASWKDVELAEREASVLSRLEHPSLPGYVEHFEEAGSLYLVMHKVEGKTLAKLVRERGLDQHGVARLLNDLADVLEYLHLRSPPLIHRDIKPSNIILRPDGSFALVDFGSVRDSLKPEGGSTVVGTFGYMAPEQFQGRALPESDVYGVGATALALLTGKEPDQLPHQGLAIDVRQALGGQVDARLTHLLEAMLRPDPDTRATNLVRLLTTYRLRMTGHDRARASSPAPSNADQARRARVDSEQVRQPRAPGHEARAGGLPQAADPWLFGNVFVVPLVLLALELGKLATWALFGVALPMLFGALSLFFGRPLRRAAVRMDYIGQRGRLAMSELGRRLSERADGEAARRHARRERRRVRVHARSRVSGGSEEPAADAWVDEPRVHERDPMKR